MNRLLKTPVAGKKSIGFSLVELMITIVILGVLASVAVPAYSGYAIASRQNNAIAKLNRLTIAMEHYYSQYRNYQVDMEDLQIPDSDSWFHYTIEHGDKASYTLQATPRSSVATTTALRIDHLGRRQHREDSGQPWQSGWP